MVEFAGCHLGGAEQPALMHEPPGMCQHRWVASVHQPVQPEPVRIVLLRHVGALDRHPALASSRSRYGNFDPGQVPSTGRRETTPLTKTAVQIISLRPVSRRERGGSAEIARFGRRRADVLIGCRRRLPQHGGRVAQPADDVMSNIEFRLTQECRPWARGPTTKTALRIKRLAGGCTQQSAPVPDDFRPIRAGEVDTVRPQPRGAHIAGEPPSCPATFGVSVVAA